MFGPKEERCDCYTLTDRATLLYEFRVDHIRTLSESGLNEEALREYARLSDADKARIHRPASDPHYETYGLKIRLAVAGAQVLTGDRAGASEMIEGLEDSPRPGKQSYGVGNWHRLQLIRQLLGHGPADPFPLLAELTARRHHHLYDVNLTLLTAQLAEQSGNEAFARSLRDEAHARLVKFREAGAMAVTKWPAAVAVEFARLRLLDAGPFEADEQARELEARTAADRRSSGIPYTLHPLPHDAAAATLNEHDDDLTNEKLNQEFLLGNCSETELPAHGRGDRPPAFPPGFQPVRREMVKEGAAAILYTFDGYWFARWRQGAADWDPPRFLGLRANGPYQAVLESGMALLSGSRLRVELAVRKEGLAKEREASPFCKDRCFAEWDLAKIEEDRDGDGLSDIAELFLTYTNPGIVDTDGDGVPDSADAYPRVSAAERPTQSAIWISAALSSYYDPQRDRRNPAANDDYGIDYLTWLSLPEATLPPASSEAILHSYDEAKAYGSVRPVLIAETGGMRGFKWLAPLVVIPPELAAAEELAGRPFAGLRVTAVLADPLSDRGYVKIVEGGTGHGFLLTRVAGIWQATPLVQFRVYEDSDDE